MDFKVNPEIFYDEAITQLDNIENLLNDIIENISDETTIDAIFREVHSLKGNAQIFNFLEIVDISHEAESLLDIYRTNNLSFSKQSAWVLMDLKELLEHLTKLYINKTTFDENTKESIGFIKKALKKESLKVSYQLRKQNFIDTNKKEDIKPDISIKTDKKTILIVDDSSMIRNVASKNAESLGYNVITAIDGQEGLSILEDYTPDLIFSDINMPRMDGLDMVSKIKMIDKFRFTPIVMMTTEKDANLKEKGKQIGVKAWVVKPFDKKKFSLVIQKILG